ncbi:DNA phosphorothioation-dependent restriction protein DptF [Periweissella ghanensis]|uniref:DNA phosphorothioation-dependent restriction protein DptF n=1 Tax=Periweissella ghanensis TaxID=467997 RepID=A0ABN8BJQ8_9LACO|nr:DNA phosphorothioation-dependent restriction protein DptF [Periweissella ghanensis]MCM0601146.1 DNA phosphorothioation-dependent restriction protein DptF [Periweissella ghanensis]CAH0417942.1 hypothetical protein WGH24286_00358 [Periweissella ghanensis]
MVGTEFSQILKLIKLAAAPSMAYRRIDEKTGFDAELTKKLNAEGVNTFADFSKIDVQHVWLNKTGEEKAVISNALLANIKINHTLFDVANEIMWCIRAVLPMQAPKGIFNLDGSLHTKLFNFFTNENVKYVYMLNGDRLGKIFNTALFTFEEKLEILFVLLPYVDKYGYEPGKKVTPKDIDVREKTLTSDGVRKASFADSIKVNPTNTTIKKQVTPATDEGFEPIEITVSNAQTTEAANLTKLEVELEKLSIKSRAAISNEKAFNDFEAYMHVKRPIEDRFWQKIQATLINGTKGIVFLIGNVGDGKSHLISYLRDKHADEFEREDIAIHNDATESNSPDKTAIETLIERLQPYQDTNINNGQQARLIVAINLGVLTNLVQVLKERTDFTNLLTYFNDSDILTNPSDDQYSTDNFANVSFFAEKEYDLADGQVISHYYNEVFAKIFAPQDSNPFYQAYMLDKHANVETITHQNYQLLMDTNIQQAAINLILKAQIAKKQIISTRTLFNFIYEVIVGSDLDGSAAFFPNSIFVNSAKSDLINSISQVDPINMLTRTSRDMSIGLFQSIDMHTYVSRQLTVNAAKFEHIFNYIDTLPMNKRYEAYLNTLLRALYFTNEDTKLFEDANYQSFLGLLVDIRENGNRFTPKLKSFISMILNNFYAWNGKVGTTDDYESFVIKNDSDSIIKLAIKVELDPESWLLTNKEIMVTFNVMGTEKQFEIVIDFELYNLLALAESGYVLKKTDRESAVRFAAFVDEVINSVSAMRDNILINTKDNTLFELRQSRMETKLSKGEL